jgi:hypothetical protein
LTENLQALEEVVVVGYGTQKKVNLTGAVASVKGEDLVRRPVRNVNSLIQGQLPGVQVIQQSGEPGNEGVSVQLEVTFDRYKKMTTDILRGSQITALVGLSAPTVNDGSMQNTGIDVGIRYSDSVKSGVFKDLHYSAVLNFDHYKNKVIKFGTREISGYDLREENRPWQTFYMLEQTGIFQSEQETASSPKQFSDDTKPGDLKFKDQDGDGDVDNDDRIPIDGKFPFLNYSFTLNADWKNFDFSAQIQGTHNVKFYLSRAGVIPFDGVPATDWYNRWTEENPSATMPGIYFGSPTKFSRNSTFFLKDGSYMRIKNITSGYTLPEKFTNRIEITRLRIYFSGDNLFTFTEFPGTDPERTSGGYLAIYPQNKIYSFGLNINF